MIRGSTGISAITGGCDGAGFAVHSFTGDIGAGGIVRNACYKAQLVLIKHVQNTTQSLDQDLIESLRKIKEEVQNVEEQALTHAVCRSVSLIGETLLDQNAILLPEVWEYFEKTGCNRNRFVSSE